MDWRDGLKVNTSKKIITGRPKRKGGGGGEDSSNKTTSIWPTNYHKLMLDFESMLYNYFHFSNYLVMASDYITFNVQIKQI